MIPNFILTRYKRDIWDNMPLSSELNVYRNMDMDKWDAIQEKLLQQQIQQILNIYPTSNIHLVTNNPLIQDPRLIIHCFSDLKSNHLVKLQVYGLLNEPGMYVDNDIIFLNKFQTKHLETSHDFNLYCQSNNYDIQSLAKEKMPVNLDNHFNASVIWIPKPSKSLVDTFYELHDKYFSDKNRIVSKGRWADSDELPVSLFVKQANWQMLLFNEISVQRSKINYNQIKKYHSVHYTGIEPKWKLLCIKEYASLHRSKMFL